MSRAEMAAALERARWDMDGLEREYWPCPRRPPPTWPRPVEALPPITPEQGRRNRLALLEAFVGVPLDEHDDPVADSPAAAGERRRSA